MLLTPRRQEQDPTPRQRPARLPNSAWLLGLRPQPPEQVRKIPRSPGLVPPPGRPVHGALPPASPTTPVTALASLYPYPATGPAPTPRPHSQLLFVPGRPPSPVPQHQVMRNPPTPPPTHSSSIAGRPKPDPPPRCPQAAQPRRHDPQRPMVGARSPSAWTPSGSRAASVHSQRGEHCCAPPR